ncbi:hypothetical protein D3C85_1857610 [compost metagenome]
MENGFRRIPKFCGDPIAVVAEMRNSYNFTIDSHRLRDIRENEAELQNQRKEKSIGCDKG